MEIRYLTFKVSYLLKLCVFLSLVLKYFHWLLLSQSSCTKDLFICLCHNWIHFNSFKWTISNLGLPYVYSKFLLISLWSLLIEAVLTISLSSSFYNYCICFDTQLHLLFCDWEEYRLKTKHHLVIVFLFSMMTSIMLLTVQYVKAMLHENIAIALLWSNHFPLVTLFLIWYLIVFTYRLFDNHQTTRFIIMINQSSSTSI